MNNKLLVRPTPFPDESLLGYIIRLSERNGYVSPSDVLKIAKNADYRYSSELPRTMHQNLSPFVNLTQQSHSLLEVLLNSPVGNTNHKIFDSSVKHRILQPFYPKFCPLCLQEKPYYRMMWDLSLVLVCPIHKCLLISNCPACDTTFKINRNHVCECACGFDLRYIKTPKELPESELRVAGHIYLQLGVQMSETDFIPLHNPLINFSLNEFPVMVRYFARLVLRAFDPEYLPYFKSRPIYTYHQAVSKTLSIFDYFPQNYINFINDLLGNNRLIENYNSYSSFTQYHSGIHRAVSADIWTFLYKAFNEIIDSLLSINSIKSQRRRYNPAGEYILISEAEKNLKISKSEFEYLIVNKQLKVKLLSHEQGKALFVESKSYVNLKLEKETWVKENTLATQFDVSVEIIKQMVEDECIPIRIKSSSNKHSHYSFDGDLFIKSLSKLRSKIQRRSASNKSDLLNFGQIEELLDFDVKQLSSFLGLCLKGRIKASLELLDKKGIRRFLFTKKDVQKFIS